MLKRVAVIINVMIVIIRVAEKNILLCKNKSRTHVGSWQTGKKRVAESQYILCFVLQITTVFITQVSSGLPIADTFARCSHLHGAMVCSNEHLYAFIGYLFERPMQRGMFEP